MKTPEKVISHIVDWLNDYLKKSKMNGFVVGVSGGLTPRLRLHFAVLQMHLFCVLKWEFIKT